MSGRRDGKVMMPNPSKKCEAAVGKIRLGVLETLRNIGTEKIKSRSKQME